jgi:transformation/transcription domain-associated protein
MEEYAKKLLDPNIKTKLAVITEIRDKIDIVHSVQYPQFLAVLMQPFMDILLKIPPSFVDNEQHRTRNTLLEVIYRFPFTETFKPYAVDLMATLMTVLVNDNEENGVLCLKIITDLQKIYTNAIESQVKEFLDIVKQMYENMVQVVPKAFEVWHSKLRATRWSLIHTQNPCTVSRF